jgi:hypothetical protein
MHVDGAAVRWLQSVEHRLKNARWGQFCAMVHERFGCGQHKALIRQLFHICQSKSITEHVDQFSSLVNQLAAYEYQPSLL